ncbi:MAG: hypothetical protein ICV68_11195, partial [Pyrinomonadaceae bacterium]|nr:hypothetical protein [Pyrinomonadaceae bacterium]
MKLNKLSITTRAYLFLTAMLLMCLAAPVALAQSNAAQPKAATATTAAAPAIEEKA